MADNNVFEKKYHLVKTYMCQNVLNYSIQIQNKFAIYQ